MTLPVTIPNTFANATTSIPLANLDANFVTIYGAVNGIGNGAEALANVNISGGTVANAAVSNTSVSATTLNTSGQVVFNDAGADVDFRVEGDTDANLLFVDASTDRVGVGTSTPSEKLQVENGALLLQANNGTTSPSAVNKVIFNDLDTTTQIGQEQGVIEWYENDGGDQTLCSFVKSVAESTSGGGALVFGTGAPLTSATERLRLTSDNYLRLAGGGIQFNGDTAAANALDDYEEGTFTPTFDSGITTPVYASQFGRYVKIGRLVNFNIRLRTTGGSASANVLRIAGLPFTSQDVQLVGGAYFVYTDTDLINSTSTNLPMPYTNVNATTIPMYKTTGADFLGTDASNVASLDIYIVGFYEAA